MVKSSCTDRVVGTILASWRYDISGISPEMRRDYEQHLAECEHCSGRQRLHRNIDVALAGLTFAAVVFCVLALAVIYRVHPLQNWAFTGLHLQRVTIALTLKAIALGGLALSLISFLVVALMTPAPGYLGGVAKEQARVLQERLPKELRRSTRDI